MQHRHKAKVYQCWEVTKYIYSSTEVLLQIKRVQYFPERSLNSKIYLLDAGVLGSLVPNLRASILTI